MKALQDYLCVRELESIIERTMILCPMPVLQLAGKLEISSPPILIRRDDPERDGVKPNY